MNEQQHQMVTSLISLSGPKIFTILTEWWQKHFLSSSYIYIIINFCFLLPSTLQMTLFEKYWNLKHEMLFPHISNIGSLAFKSLHYLSVVKQSSSQAVKEPRCLILMKRSWIRRLLAERWTELTFSFSELITIFHRQQKSFPQKSCKSIKIYSHFLTGIYKSFLLNTNYFILGMEGAQLEQKNLVRCLFYF